MSGEPVLLSITSIDRFPIILPILAVLKLYYDRDRLYPEIPSTFRQKY